MNNITNKQLIIVCTATGVLVTGSIVGIVTFEKRRKEYLERVKKAQTEEYSSSWLPFVYDATKYCKPIDQFGSTSPDPENVVISEKVTDKVDRILPESVGKMEGRFAQTKNHRYIIYADMAVTRPGEYLSIFLDYYNADNTFIYNGFVTSPSDIEAILGRDFTEEILSLGMGADLQLLIFSTTLIGSFDSFFRIVLTFHKEGSPDMAEPYDTIPEDEEYDPDDPAFAEPDEDAEPIDEDEAVQELLDAEEIDAEERVFDPYATIDLDMTGELDEEDLAAGWTTTEWKYRMTDTGFIHDEDDVPISQDDAIEWLTLPILAIICSDTVLQQYPSRMIYVRNGKLKIMFEITID